MYGNDYTIDKVFDDLTDAVFKEDRKGKVNSVRRNLQTEYVNRLIGIVGKEKASNYDYISQATAFSHLKTIKTMMSKRPGKDTGTKQHREFLQHRISLAIDQH